MPKAMFEVDRADEGDMHDLIETMQNIFPGRRIVRHYHGCIARVEVEGTDARDVLRATRAGSDDPSFESAASLAAASAKQSELPLENAIECARATC